MSRTTELRTHLLLAKGYFPTELPPPFKTNLFADFMNTAALTVMAAGNPQASRFERYSQARAGHRRRQLGIPNPIHYYITAKTLAENWIKIKKELGKSSLSISTPKFVANGDRAISCVPFGDIYEKRALSVQSKKYIVTTDIAQYYPSIYTHSIPWAIHGKDVCKANLLKKGAAKTKLFGDDIDLSVRNCQQKQTKGIPVGPDTSMIISEIIGADIDKNFIQENMDFSGFRYVDDYFLCFRSLPDAEKSLSKLSHFFSEYELSPNDVKTDIIESGKFCEPTWSHILSSIDLKVSARKQGRRLQHLFEEAFKQNINFPEMSVLKYALSCSHAVQVGISNWSIYSSYLLKCAASQPSCIDIVTNTIFSYQQLGYPVPYDEIKKFCEDVICAHSPLQHHSEVAWALWMSKVLNVSISEKAANCVGDVNSSVCALLSLDLETKGLVDGALNKSNWLSRMISAELYEDMWLLAYEAAHKGWLPTRSPYINNHPQFSLLHLGNVSFYDENQNAIDILSEKKAKMAENLSENPFFDLFGGNVYA